MHRTSFPPVPALLASLCTALAASTTEAGRFLGRDFGVGVGDVANLVVLDASPIEDIRNTQRIRMVVLRGEVVFGG